MPAVLTLTGYSSWADFEADPAWIEMSCHLTLYIYLQRHFFPVDKKINSMLTAVASLILTLSPSLFYVYHTEYTTPKPPPGSGPHRYYFLLYKQFEFRQDPESLISREGFDIASFALQQQLDGPVAGTMFRTQAFCY